MNEFTVLFIFVCGVAITVFGILTIYQDKLDSCREDNKPNYDYIGRDCILNKGN